MKTFVTFLFSLISVAVLAQTPVNDDCSGLIDLGVVPYCSDPGQYTNVGATASDIDPVLNIPDCFNNGVERDVWFQFMVPADGSIVDVVVSVFGNTGGNGTLQMPQIAVYRGDCVYGGLAELDCIAAPLNVNEVSIELFGLTPGLPYYLRINDYSASATPNEGTFKLCIEQYVPDINIGETPGTQSCSGTLWDSGGPSGDYQPGENLSFSICPQDYHQCIILNVENFDLEFGYDFINFYQGDINTGVQLTQLTGAGQDFEVQVSGDCATIQFVSDFFVQWPGFQITWTCSPDACTVPPPTSCAEPVAISGMPYEAVDLSNCFSGNSISNGPCDDDFLSGNDYVFSYTSPGDECIQITTTGTNQGAGIGVYDNCPDLPGANCITAVGGGFAANPVVQAAFLENPGTYYIVFGSGISCSPFNISIDTVTCPVVLPPASTCDNALDIGGCSNLLPEIIALNPGAGDPGFIQQGVNQGCFVDPQENFAFFYFTAQADGTFGFIVEAADPAEASDIDFNVWGPINTVDEICEHVSNNQPIRSSWTGGDFPTGMADINPETNLPVLDDYDCGSPATPGAGGDRFVRTIDVLEGEVYVIMLDDYGNSIIQGGISIDFTGTTVGVLGVPEDSIMVSADTAVCTGTPVQLYASGGVAYFWSPDQNLSCSNCPDPIATPLVSTTYQVQIATTCNTYTRTVNIKNYDVNLGPDVTVCNNAAFELNPNPYDNVSYSWIGGPGLSCYDCPSPVVSGLATGIYTYICLLTTPDCEKSDTIKVTVINGQSPQYIISDDQVICAGQTVFLGGAEQAGTFYDWASSPTGFVSTVSNPAVAPAETTVYYLFASNNSCPITTLDSVVVTVYQTPVLNVLADTTICEGQSLVLGATTPDAGVTYLWQPAGTLDNANIANPLATPLQTSIYVVAASNPGCVVSDTITVSVIELSLSLNLVDTIHICQGSKVQFQAQVDPAGVPVIWTPSTGLNIGPGGLNVIAQPMETTLYTASVTVPGCTRSENIYITVDSLPDLEITPGDTTICQGEKAVLKSVAYEPAEYPNIGFVWLPVTGTLTPDSLFNLVVQPNVSTVYRRIVTNGACKDTTFSIVTVIPTASLQATPTDTTVCPGSSVQLGVTYTPGVTNITWEPANLLSCSTCNDPVATVFATTSFMVSGENQGCPVNATITVDVLNPPVYQFPSDVKLCIGESIVLNQIAEPNTTYIWTSTDPNFGIVDEAQPVATPLAGSTTYFLQANNGCPDSAQLTVTVFAATLSISPDTTICKNASATLMATGSLMGTYSWNNGQNGQVIVVSPTQSNTYTVVYTYGDNCQLAEQVTVNVQGEEVVFVFPDDKQLCPGDSVLLNTGPVLPGAVYSWTSVPPGFTSSLANPEVSPAQNTTYNVTATIGNCSVSEQVSIVANSATVSVSADTTICAEDPITIQASGSASGSFFWEYNGQTSQNQSVFDTPLSNTVYMLTYTYGDSCTIQEEVSVTVAPKFTVEIVPEPDTTRFNLGEEITLTAEITPAVNLNGYQFNWIQSGTSLGINQQELELVLSSNDSLITFQVQVSSPGGCVKGDLLNITLVQPVVAAVNAFTPNGDDNNDVFRLTFTEGKGIIEQMEIYNRWGTKVFSSNDPNAVWDGRSDGKEAPSDVYVYLIRWRTLDGALQPLLKGDVTLLR